MEWSLRKYMDTGYVTTLLLNEPFPQKVELARIPNVFKRNNNFLFLSFLS